MTRGRSAWARRTALSSCTPEAPRRCLRTGMRDRKSTRLNSSHTEIYTLSLHDALPILAGLIDDARQKRLGPQDCVIFMHTGGTPAVFAYRDERSEEHTSELQSHRDLHSFPTRRSSDLGRPDR